MRTGRRRRAHFHVSVYTSDPEARSSLIVRVRYRRVISKARAFFPVTASISSTLFSSDQNRQERDGGEGVL